MIIKKLILLTSVTALLSSCSNFRPKDAKDEEAPMDSEDRRKFTFGSVVGDETLMFGGPKKRASSNNAGVSVNAYLWQASLEAIKFMPLVSTDANGGVIVTDWYTCRGNSSEGPKANSSWWAMAQRR